MDAAVLSVEGLTRSFPGTRVLENLTFAVRAGEVHALVGKNGAGKTTLLMILSAVSTAGRAAALPAAPRDRRGGAS